MIWKVLFLFFGWIYFIFEGITEAIATKENPNLKTEIQQDNYHGYRAFEMAGIFFSVLVVMLAAGFYFWIPTLILVCGSGLGLYEMAFSWWSYDNPLFNKTSKWFGIPHPKGIFFRNLFLAATGLEIIWEIIVIVLL